MTSMATYSDQASANAVLSLKRKQEEAAVAMGSHKMMKFENRSGITTALLPKVPCATTSMSHTAPLMPHPKSARPVKRRVSTSKAREIRLEQNRKAAKESRRRKKGMVEELQRSVIFFSRANGALKQQNDELTRILLQAQAKVALIEQHALLQKQQQERAKQQQLKEQAASAPEHSGAQPAACNNSAQGTINEAFAMPQMQPGASMKAMASFQQAATAAMQAAVQGMGQQAAPQPAPTHTALIQDAAAAMITAQQHAAFNNAVASLVMQAANNAKEMNGDSRKA